MKTTELLENDVPYTSSIEQDKRLEHLFSKSEEAALKTLYLWVKASEISPDQFVELVQWILKK